MAQHAMVTKKSCADVPTQPVVVKDLALKAVWVPKFVQGAC